MSKDTVQIGLQSPKAQFRNSIIKNMTARSNMIKKLDVTPVNEKVLSSENSDG